MKELQGVTALVTGAAGFVGSHLVGRLLAEGARVHAVDLLDTPSPALLSHGTGFDYHSLNLLDTDATAALVQRVNPAKVFHLAAHTDVGRGLDRLGPAVNDLQSTVNLLRLIEEIDCSSFVLTGTCEEYGDNPAPFTEDQSFNPVSPYSASKSAAVLFGRMLHKTSGLPVVVLRPFLTYGPWQATCRFIPSAIEAALAEREFPMTEGRQTREFNYVTDIVDGFVRASVSAAAIGEIINIGNGVEYTLRGVVEKIADIAGKPLNAKFGAIPYRPGETWHFYCSNRKAQKLLGWTPKVSLDDGLRETIAWYAGHGS